MLPVVGEAESVSVSVAPWATLPGALSAVQALVPTVQEADGALHGWFAAAQLGVPVVLSVPLLQA